jgi:excisionase family DNA binding protein
MGAPSMTDQQSEYFTEAEACAFLGVSRQTLTNYVNRKLIKKYKRAIGREVRYKRAELEKLLEYKPEEPRE